MDAFPNVEDDNDLEEFLGHIEDDAFVYAPRIRLVDRDNPLDWYTDEEFFVRYRFQKVTVTDVLLPMLRPDNADLRGVPVPRFLQLLAVLRFYATGSFQIVAGDFHELAQSTMSRIIKVISIEFAGKLPEVVKIPQSNEELATARNLFYRVAHFPGVVGCVDCTHIPITSPGGELAEVYRNRKGYFSLNVQVVVGPRLEILDIVCRWPGSTHDARIFHNSRLRLRFDRDEVSGLLLGDSGYPQLRYLYTPVRNPATPAERRYNASHIATRSAVERAFGIWKRRFPCLSMKLRTATQTSAKIILACAVLHNVAISQREPVPENIHLEDPHADVPIPAVQNRNLRATAERRAFINRHFARHQ
ncbi:putative nuclease HARBI1 [Ischnura elegans]|uniref:putative nuclease HARBI1 n=1 Tax=Ischnura elegans TaxID=197161 RepID=UPI001ED86AED|nr:putative nuclease HARBI1 [Ischnura elegans]XP_046406174.1 putative nuclease HARBI1 [Ischnura elegans]